MVRPEAALEELFAGRIGGQPPPVRRGGGNGPFSSALSSVGTVSLSSGRARQTPTTPTSLVIVPGHKVEGIVCNGTTADHGVDDQNLGGWGSRVVVCG